MTLRLNIMAQVQYDMLLLSKDQNCHAKFEHRSGQAKRFW